MSKLLKLLPQTSCIAFIKGHLMHWSNRFYNNLLIVTVLLLFIYCKCLVRFLFKTFAALCLAAFLMSMQQPNHTTSFAASPKNPFMTLIPKRLVIHPSDVMAIHDCSASSASRKIQMVKDALAKKAWHLVSIEEYCSHFGLVYIDTCKFLKLL
jgi:hypothetical protein